MTTAYVLSDDLIDASRVPATRVRTFAALLDAVGRTRPAVVVVDLHHPELDLPALMATGCRVVGYGSHVDAARLRAARAAGCEALPRSAFFERVGELMAGT